jgi:hypothetical protein
MGTACAAVSGWMVDQVLTALIDALLFIPSTQIFDRGHMDVPGCFERAWRRGLS